MADEPHKAFLFPPFHIPAGVDVVYRGDVVVPLEPRAVRLLRYLVAHRDRIVTKEELLDAVWPDVFTTDAVLKTAVAKVRRALGDGARWIETHHRRGYRFVGDASDEPGAIPARPATNLPQPVTRLVGRDEQVASVREAITISRLVTLVGPGGIGKTRLALETAATLLPEAPDGVWLVELASVTDRAHVADTIAGVLGVRERAGGDVLDSLRAWLGDKSLLLVLDNCEHLVEACAHIAADLLRAAAGLRLIATSREALAVAGEAVCPVPALAEADAIRLFVDRARLRNPRFELTRANSAAVAEVCRGLDGIPLAVELAAARARALSAEQIAARLGDRFRLLGPADRSAPARHRTLRAVVDWSHELLSDDERTLFRRLSVFAGGFTLEAAEAIHSAPDSAPRDRPSAFDVLEHLVDKSLVTVDEQGGAARYAMFETIRQYAAERLAEAGEDAPLRAAHRDFFAALATRLFKNAYGRIAEDRGRAARADYENLRAALRSGLEQGEDPETAARIAVALGLYWQVRGHSTEGRRWLDLALEAGDALVPAVRARALVWAGALAQEQGEFERARELLEECFALQREEGDAIPIDTALHFMGHVLDRLGRADEAEACREEFLSRMRASGDTSRVAAAANGLGLSALGRGDYERAATRFAEALAIFESNHDAANASVALHNLGDIALRRDEPQRAVELLERSVALARDAQALRVVAHSTHMLGYAALELGRRDEAVSLFGDALALDEEQADREGVAFVLEGLARASATTDSARAMRLAGAAGALRETIHAPIPVFEREALDRALAAARDILGTEAADAAFAEGRAMSFERAVGYAHARRRASEE